MCLHNTWQRIKNIIPEFSFHQISDGVPVTFRYPSVAIHTSPFYCGNMWALTKSIPQNVVPRSNLVMTRNNKRHEKISLTLKLKGAENFRKFVLFSRVRLKYESLILHKQIPELKTPQVLLQLDRCSPTKYANYQIDNIRNRKRVSKHREFSMVDQSSS